MRMYNFDYFLGNEAEQFYFYKIPQLLFTDDKFKKLSSDAKILYGLMLDRVSLSYKNEERFTDELGRAFIYFTRETAMDMLNCGRDKSADIYKELEDIGLIERKRQGLGKPTKIYVKHFNRMTDDNSRLQEVGKADFKRSEKPTSRGRENRLQEVGKTDTIHTNINQTNVNHTDLNQSFILSENQTEKERESEREKTKNLSFSEIISEIGYNSFYVPENEQEAFEPDYDVLKNCRIPYSFVGSLKNTKLALAFLFGYNFYSESMDELDRNFFRDVINNLADMIAKENEYNSYDVIDKFNEVLIRSNPYDWFVSFISNWTEVNIEMAEKGKKVKFPNALMRKCMFNWFDNFTLNDDCLCRSIPEVTYSEIGKYKPIFEEKSETNEEQILTAPESSEQPCETFSGITPDGDITVADEPVSDVYSDSQKTEEEYDFTLRNEVSYSEASHIAFNPAISLTEKINWFDENVENWRDSEHLMCVYIREKIQNNTSGGKL